MADEASARRAALVLWTALAALAAARAAAAFAPSMWAWGLDLQRFLPPLPAWLPWALAAAALAPPVARRLASAGAVEGFDPGRAPWPAVLAVGAAALVWLLPDRLQYVGDFQLRVGAASGNIPSATLFPQALPLDVLLHHSLPAALSGWGRLDVAAVARVLGAIEAAALGALAAAFVRALGLRGPAALAAVSVALCGGYLAMFTGYPKAFREMSLLTAAVGAFGVRVALEGRGVLALGIAVAAGLALHRSALGLLPALAAAWIFGFPRYRGSLRRPHVLAGLALPIVALAAMAPRIATALVTYDAAHVAPEGASFLRSLPATLAPARLADIANTILFHSPLSVAALPLAVALGSRVRRGREAALLLALAAPFLAALLLVHPKQGMFRDWDDFAATGVALSLATAWLVGETLRAARARAWLGAAVALGVAAPAVQWLVHLNDVRSGLRRVEAYLAGPPPRPDGVRAASYNYLGVRYLVLGDKDRSVEAWRRAAEIAPSPRLLYEWAMAEAARGNLRKSREILRGVVEKAAPLAPAWLALGTVSFRLGDHAEARRAVERALEIDPGQREARELLDRIEKAEGDAARAP